MRILIDALSARIGGGVTYIQNMLPALSRIATGHTLTIALSSVYQQSLIDEVPQGVEIVQVELPARPLAQRWWYLQTQLPMILRRQKIDLFFAPAEGSYFRVPTRFVMMARNPSVYASLDSFGAHRVKLLLHRISRQPLVFHSLHKADRVVFVSSSFRDQVVKRMKLNPSKTRVIHHGLSPVFWERAPQSSLAPGDRPYFISVSTINPHKNFETLLRAYASLPAGSPDLVIAGDPRHEPTFRRLQEIAAEEKAEDRVHFLGEVPYHELPALYQHAV